MVDARNSMARALSFVVAVTLAASVAGPAAQAQDLGYGRGYGYDYYADPGYGDRSYPGRNVRGASPDGYDDGYGYQSGRPIPRSVYVDPYADNRDPYGSRQGYDYDAGGRSELRDGVTTTTRVEVENPTRQPAGTIVIDTSSRHLYLVEPNGRAMRYGIGVGRQGFAWHGTAAVKRKAEWPGWTPPNDMLKRRPDLPLHMEGGIENPLGARALYLYQGNRDTMFRIHGTNEPDTIGQAVSSGCIRMMNGDVIDLYQRVPIGTRVVVL